METRPKDKNLRTVSFAAHATRGIIRDQSTRRTAMCLLLATAALMLVAGSTALRELLDPHEHVTRFLLFWFSCGWLTVTALLLAVLDLLLVRAQARAERKAMTEEFGLRTSADPGRATGESQTEPDSE